MGFRVLKTMKKTAGERLACPFLAAPSQESSVWDSESWRPWNKPAGERPACPFLCSALIRIISVRFRVLETLKQASREEVRLPPFCNVLLEIINVGSSRVVETLMQTRRREASLSPFCHVRLGIISAGFRVAKTLKQTNRWEARLPPSLQRPLKNY